MQSNILKSKMALADISQDDLRKLMGKNGVPIDYSSLNLKINGRREFKQNEISAIIRSLKLSDKEAMAIFFAKSVS